MNELESLRKELAIINAKEQVKAKRLRVMEQEAEETKRLKKIIYAKKHPYKAGAKNIVKKFFSARGNEDKVMDFIMRT